MDKKNWWLVPIVLLPYLILSFLIFIGVICVNPEFFRLANSLDTDSAMQVLIIFLTLSGLTAVCTVTFAVKGIRKKWEPLQLAKSAMIVKLIQIPAYVLFGICGFLGAITVFGTLITILIILVDCMILILTACLSAAAAINGSKQGSLSKAECIGMAGGEAIGRQKNN